MGKPGWYVFDFDSTFIQVEALEELARISLAKDPQKKAKIAEIEALTSAGIDGRISFTDGLRARLGILKAKSSDLEKLIASLKKKVSPSVKRNRKFFLENRDRILIVSAGFREFIVPVVSQFGIPESQVYANTFRISRDGKITGFDENNLLSKSGGKFLKLKSMGLKGDVKVVGDGYSDAEMKKAGKHVSFTAFTENIIRESAVQAADHVAPSLDELLFMQKQKASVSFPKNRIKVLLLEDIHADAVKMFRDEGYQVVAQKAAMTEAELVTALKDVSILGIRSKTQVTKKAIDSASRLMAVGAFCIGTNQIDLGACMDKGVCVFNAPYSNTRSVVELVLGEIIMLMRGIIDKNNLLHAGKWLKSAGNSREIRGKTLGIVGYGNIGSQLSVIAEALGMHVCFYDKADKLALGNAKRCASLKELLKQADIVSLHVDGDPANKDLIGKKEIASMKKGGILLNLSRGHVVDIAAFAEALRSGHLLGGSVDVFPYEPKSNDEPFVSDLQKIPNLILTPHIGGSTEEAQQNIGQYVPGKLIAYINSGSSSLSVNFPNIQLPELRNAHRLIHIHRNVPGVLAKINSILAENRINIEGQYLKTNERIGYVITDINKKYDDSLLSQLKTIEGTIRFRVLY